MKALHWWLAMALCGGRGGGACGGGGMPPASAADLDADPADRRPRPDPTPSRARPSPTPTPATRRAPRPRRGALVHVDMKAPVAERDGRRAHGARARRQEPAAHREARSRRRSAGVMKLLREVARRQVHRLPRRGGLRRARRRRKKIAAKMWNEFAREARRSADGVARLLRLVPPGAHRAARPHRQEGARAGGWTTSFVSGAEAARDGKADRVRDLPRGHGDALPEHGLGRAVSRRAVLIRRAGRGTGQAVPCLLTIERAFSSLAGTMQGLTQRQQMVLDFIRQSIHDRGYPPTLREIGARMGIRSTNGVNDHLRALERKGYLTREDMKSRALRPDGPRRRPP